jgi:hypothetical protein
MKDLPRLELTEDPSKSNDFIIFRHSIKGSIKKTSKNNTNNTNNTKKRVRTKRVSKRVKNRTTRRSKKGFLNIFYN